MSRAPVKIVSAAVCLLFGLTATFSQSEKGQISGQVTDPQGLVVPKVAVEVVNRDTSAKRETKTDDAGHFVVAELPGGRYQVTVLAQGFSTAVSEDLSLATGQALVFNVQLTVGGESESINVQGGGAAQIETTNAEVTGTLKQAEVESYGLN